MDISKIRNYFFNKNVSFLKYYGAIHTKSNNGNGFISIESICSLNKIEKILSENKKKIFEILTVLGD